MNGCNMKVMIEFGMKYGDITKPDNPFRIFGKFPEVQLIDNPHTAISSPCAHDGMDTRIIEHLLHVGKTFSIRSAKNKIPGSHGPAQANIKPPAFDGVNGRL